MRYIILIGFALFAVTAVVGIDGCSIIGLTIGAISDASKPDTVTVPGWRMETIERGRSIKVILKDGDQVAGKFVGIVRAPEAEYAQRYGDFCQGQPEELGLPRLGDQVTIILGNRVTGEREFLGFDYHYPATEDEAKALSNLVVPNYVILVRSMGDTALGRVSLAGIDEVEDSQGNALDGKILANLVSEKSVPLTSTIGLEQLAGTTQVAMDQVYQIDVKAKKTGAKTGFIAGAIIDVIVIAVAATSGDSESKPTTQEPGDVMCGCPFIYSYDGEGYVLDSEAFGGSIFEAAKRTDLGKLDNLRETNGICRLKIVDELEEIDYIDEVKLLAVDHPKGTEVVSSLSGELHTLSDPQAPISAVDWRGNNVLDLVEEKDDRFWVSNPFGRNPEMKAQARDGFDLQLPRPRNAPFVKLSLNVQNTLWAAHLQSHFLELHGNQLNDWYQLMNSSVEDREKFQKVMIREGMLLIKLWNGDDWQTRDFVWEVGANVFRDQVVRLDIGDIPGDVLRVRLECPPGFWMVNSVQADYTPDLPLQITEISPSEATDHLGGDLRQILQSLDDRYHVMHTQDWAELAFPVPPRKQTLLRSYALKSAGYYIINVPVDGPPQAELIERFMTEPFAFGQYTLQLLNGYLASAFASSQER
jgi:hypothetical protein